MLLFFFLTSLAQAASVSWSGVDYELVWLIDGSRFLHEGELFPHNARLWNKEFREQTLPGLSPRMGVDIVDATEHTDALRLGMTRYGHVFDMPHAAGTPMLEPADIELRLANYPPGEKGLSLALIADHLDGPAKKGCYWVTFYETKSRAPLSMDFRCGTASGTPDERWVRAQHAVAATLRNEDVPRRAMEGASESELAAARKRRELADARAREAGWRRQSPQRSSRPHPHARPVRSRDRARRRGLQPPR